MRGVWRRKLHTSRKMDPPGSFWTTVYDLQSSSEDIHRRVCQRIVADLTIRRHDFLPGNQCPGRSTARHAHVDESGVDDIHDRASDCTGHHCRPIGREWTPIIVHYLFLHLPRRQHRPRITDELRSTSGPSSSSSGWMQCGDCSCECRCCRYRHFS